MATLLHLGAHRTGTSGFQHFLKQNHAAFAEAGYQALYPGRDVPGRGTLKLRLPGPKLLKSDPQGALSALSASLPPQNLPHRLISEENMLGRMMPFWMGQF